MDQTVVPSLCVPYLSLSDAMVLRCVSRGWRDVFKICDDNLWEECIDATHGSAAAEVLRQHLFPMKGWKLALFLYHENESDLEISRLQPEDVTCLVELSWWPFHDVGTLQEGEKQRKIQLGSIIVEDACSIRGNALDFVAINSTKPKKPSIIIPNPFPCVNENDCPTCALSKMAETLDENLDVRVTLFRRDTRQSMSTVLARSGRSLAYFGLLENGYQAMVRRCGDYRAHIQVSTTWRLSESPSNDEWKEQLKNPRVILHLEQICLSFLHGDYCDEDIEDEDASSGDEPFQSVAELMNALDNFPWRSFQSEGSII